MANPWFRMYSEFAHDPKVQRLSETDQRRYLMVLCLRCSNGDVTLHETDVAFQLRISDAEWMQTKGILLERGLIDSDNKPTGWGKRQYASDVSAPRVRKFRAKKKEKSNGDVTLQERKGNALDTDTDTESDTHSAEDISNSDKPKKNKKDSNLQVLVAAGVQEQAAKDWIEIRKAKHAPITRTALQAIADEAELAGITFADAITHCAKNNWQGFKAEWMNKPPPPNGSVQQARLDIANQIMGGTRNADDRQIIDLEPIRSNPGDRESIPKIAFGLR